jgi:hypothetical protein
MAGINAKPVATYLVTYDDKENKVEAYVKEDKDKYGVVAANRHPLCRRSNPLNEDVVGTFSLTSAKPLYVQKE